MSPLQSWSRFQKLMRYILRRDWAGLWYATEEFLIWKGLLPSQSYKTAAPFLPQIRSGFFSGENAASYCCFEAFLEFELKVFGRDFPVASYDPYLIRYGEYRFALDMLAPRPGEVIMDVGCGPTFSGFSWPIWVPG